MKVVAYTSIGRSIAAALGVGIVLLAGGCTSSDASDDDRGTSADEVSGKSARLGAGWVVMGFVADLRAAVAMSPASTTGDNFTKVSGAIAAKYGYGLESLTVRGPIELGYFVDGVARARTAQTASVNGETVAIMTGKLSGDAAQRLFSAMPPVPSAEERTSPAGRISCVKDVDAKITCFLGGIVGFATEPPGTLGAELLP